MLKSVGQKVRNQCKWYSMFRIFYLHRLSYDQSVIIYLFEPVAIFKVLKKWRPLIVTCFVEKRDITS